MKVTMAHPDSTADVQACEGRRCVTAFDALCKPAHPFPVQHIAYEGHTHDNPHVDM